jgi:hypothetical protein
MIQRKSLASEEASYSNDYSNDHGNGDALKSRMATGKPTYCLSATASSPIGLRE